MIVIARWMVLITLLFGLAGDAGIMGFQIDANDGAHPDAANRLRIGNAVDPRSGLVAAAAAGAMSYTTTTTPLRQSPGGDAIGTVTPGTPVSVSATQGPYSHVSIEGWSASGSNAVVAAIGQRILLVIVTAPARAERQTGTQTKDAYGTTWTQVTISGWVTTSVLTSDIQAVWARASKLYASHCSTCHALHAPDEFAANQWPGVLQSMADRSGLSGDDLALVLKYLQTHAKAR